MASLRLLHILVLLICLAAGIYYSVVDNEIQGAVVILLGILFVLAIPRITGE